MGRPSKEISPTAEGLPLAEFLRGLHFASKKTWRQLGDAGHISHNKLSQGADGRLVSQWETVELWLRSFYKAVGVESLAGWSLAAALVHARRLWEYCHECARQGTPPDAYVDPSPAGSDPGTTLVMEVSAPGVAVRPPTEAATWAVVTQFRGANLRRVGLHNLHEARNAAEFIAAIEEARAAAGVPWDDLMAVVRQGIPASDRTAIQPAWPQAAG